MRLDSFMSATGCSLLSTKRNRDAVDWIEAQLKSYGCQNVERITYRYNPAPRPAGAFRRRPPVTSPNGKGTPGNGPGGSRIFSDMRERGGANDSLSQPDPAIRAIRAIHMEQSTPGERQEGTKRVAATGGWRYYNVNHDEPTARNAMVKP